MIGTKRESAARPLSVRSHAAPWLTGLLVLLVTLVGAASLAQGVVIRGQGELRAAGNGVAVLELRGQVVLRGIGIAIVDEDAIVKTEGHGRTTRLDDGRVLFEGYGRIVVRALRERTRVEVAGAHLRIAARGRGVAFLKGVGHFSTRHHEGPWANDLEIELSEADDE